MDFYHLKYMIRSIDLDQWNKNQNQVLKMINTLPIIENSLMSMTNFFRMLTENANYFTCWSTQWYFDFIRNDTFDIGFWFSTDFHRFKIEFNESIRFWKFNVTTRALLNTTNRNNEKTFCTSKKIHKAFWNFTR